MTNPKPSSPAEPATDRARRIAMLGNPNVGKTTLFNRLVGTQRKTANFPGTTQEAHLGVITGGHELIDLPGIYGLALSAPESSLCRGVLEGSTAPAGTKAHAPDALIITLDATNLLRSLALGAEALPQGVPAIVAVNLIDEAQRRGLHVDAERLEHALGVPVVLVCARTGEGVDRLQELITDARPSSVISEPFASRDELEAWTDRVYADVASAHDVPAHDQLADRLDRAFTHPVLGVGTFAAVMTGLFWVIFKLAQVPMDLIDTVFGRAAAVITATLPEGPITSLLADGVVAGVGGTVIFLPQILLLFLLIALLEQTGYLARAAFVIDRLLRPFGLPGHAFVPLLSAHACAIPAIMSARAVPDRRDRLATILAIPFMSCSARIPVYVLLTALLFPGSPGLQALAFTGCYALGAAAGLLTSLLVRRTVLRGRSLPMALELPSYRLPDPVDAARISLARGWAFLKKAGTTILAISVILWWLGSYPEAPPSPQAQALREQAALVEFDDAQVLEARADALDASHAASFSLLGRIGEAVQPVFAPLGADRQLTVGILASYAAREVFVSTMAVQIAGTDDTEDQGVFDALAGAARDDGSPMFNRATSWSMLVFFVLSMQCLPTLVVTAREAGAGRDGWKWAAVQFAWMTAVAYGGAAAAFAMMGGWAGGGVG